MRRHEQWGWFICVVAACGFALGGGTARAAVITTSPTLPPLGAPFVSAGGVGCFPAAGVCVQPGSLTFTSVVSTTFIATGQEIVANASYEGTLTTLSNTPIGPITLGGTVEQLVLGRTFSTQTGTWSTELLAMSLTGPVLGNTLTLVLGSTPSTGMASIDAIGEGLFRIDSFFDIFVELSLDSVPPLNATRGPIRAELAPAGVPEPSVVTLLAAALLGLVGMQGRRRTRACHSWFRM
jgi:hypothetical protein